MQKIITSIFIIGYLPCSIFYFVELIIFNFLYEIVHITKITNTQMKIK